MSGGWLLVLTLFTYNRGTEEFSAFQALLTADQVKFYPEEAAAALRPSIL